MFKFLRRYSKWLLAIFGTGLMITFLVPFAIQSLPQLAARRSATWAYLGEKESVPRTAQIEAQNELEVLDRIGLGVPVFGNLDSAEHWFLLVREAEMAGVIGGSMIDQLPPEALEQWGQRLGGARLSTLDRALTKRVGVAQLMSLYQGAGKFSDYRLRHEAERLAHNVEVRSVILSAEAKEDLPEPTEEQIREQFEKYRDVAPGTVAPGFGYRIPDRLKIEWLRIPGESIRQQIESSGEINGIALFKHWQRNAESQGFPPVAPDEDIPDVVRQSLLNELIAKKREALVKFITDRLEASRRRLKRDEEGYYVLSEDWEQQQVDFRSLAQQVSEREDFQGLPTPVYNAIGDRWITTDDLRSMLELAMPFTEKYGGRTGIPAMAEAAKEFGGDPIMLIQEGITGPPLTSDGDVLFFRITDTDPAHAPEELELVRDAVVADVRRQAHFEQLLERKDEIEQIAQQEGLLTVALEHDSEVRRSTRLGLYSMSWLDNDLRQGAPLTPRPIGLPGTGAHLPSIEAVIDRALTLPKDVDLGDVPRSQRTFIVPIEDQLSLAVVELTKQYPLSEEQFEQMVTSGALQAMLLNEELSQFDESLQTAFGYEALTKRHNFRLNLREEAEEEPDEVRTAAAN